MNEFEAPVNCIVDLEFRLVYRRECLVTLSFLKFYFEVAI